MYETGSQTADLFLVLKVMTSNKDMRSAFLETFSDMSYNLFPDLVLEMGLCQIEKDIYHFMLESPEKDDHVMLLDFFFFHNELCFWVIYLFLVPFCEITIKI